MKGRSLATECQMASVRKQTVHEVGGAEMRKPLKASVLAYPKSKFFWKVRRNSQEANFKKVIF